MGRLVSEHLCKKTAAAADPDPRMIAHLVAMMAGAMEPAIVGRLAIGHAGKDILGAGRGSGELGPIAESFLPDTGDSCEKNFSRSMS